MQSMPGITDIFTGITDTFTPMSYWVLCTVLSIVLYLCDKLITLLLPVTTGSMEIEANIMEHARAPSLKECHII